MSDERFAFVLMPFDKEFDAVYEKLIKPTLTDAGYAVARADSTLDQRNILKNIIPNIHRADLVVAELTTLRPNVMYELGIAHALRRPVVMITQNLEEVPFDLRSYTVIVYSDRFSEVDEFRTKLREIAVAHTEGRVTFENPVTDFVPAPGPEPVADKERLEEKREQTPIAESTIGEEGEPGIVDLMVQAEEAAAEYGAAMTELTEHTNVLATNQSRHLDALKSLDQSAPGAASRTQAILKSLGFDLITYSEKVNALVETRFGSLDRLIEIGERMLAHPRQETTKREDLTKLSATLSDLQSTLANGQQTIQETRGFLQQLTGYSRMLDMGVRRTEQTLDRLRNSVLSSDSRLARLINLIDERLST